MKKLTGRLTVGLLLMALAVVWLQPLEVQAASKKYVTGIEVDSTAEEMLTGDSTTVNATVTANGTLSKTQLGVKVKSSNAGVVTAKVTENPDEASESGDSEITLTAKKPGTAKITITTKGKTKSGKTMKATFTVKVTNAEYVTAINASDVTVTVKVPEDITAVVETNEPMDADKLKVSVKSSKTAVVSAKVTKNPSDEEAAGTSVITLTPKKTGQATITITAASKDENGKKVTKKIKVTVVKDSGGSGSGSTGGSSDEDDEDS